MKPSARFRFMSPPLRSFPVQTGHFDCDSRLIATFRWLFVLPRNLLMKYRLFGDLETIQHNRQSHNERFLPRLPFFFSLATGLQRRKKAETQKQRRAFAEKNRLYSIHKVYKGKFHRSGFLRSSGPTNGCTDKSCHKTLLFILAFQSYSIQRFFVCLFVF